MEKQIEQYDPDDIMSSGEEGFGFRFKKVRDEYNLTVDDVSRELHLDNKVIVALENEDYEHLPVAAFVCGYIRNYARFLKIDAEPLIEYYKKAHNDELITSNVRAKEEKKIRASIGRAMAEPSKKSSYPILTMLIALLFIFAVLLAGWQLWPYVSELIQTETETETEVKQQPEDKLPGNIDEDSDVLLLPELNGMIEKKNIEKKIGQQVEQTVNNMDDVASVSLFQQETDSAIIQDDTSGQTEGFLSTTNSSSPEGSLRAEGSLPAEGSSPIDNSSLAENSLSQENSSSLEGSSPLEGSANTPLSLSDNGGDSSANTEILDNDSASENDVVVPQSVKHNQLVLLFSGKSWVKIRDANNKKLASDLMKQGKALHLDGKLPYNVFLGDARVVTVSLNNVVFDHSSYIKSNNTAHFKVR